MLAGLAGDFIRVRSLAAEPRWNEINEVVLREASTRGVLGILAKTG